MKDTIRIFICIISVFATLFGVIQFFGIDLSEISDNSFVKVLYLTGTFVCAFLLSLLLAWILPKIKQNIFKNRSIKKCCGKTELNICKNDIFEMQNNIVIPVNNYFDTIVNNELVSATTLHGMFIERYFKNRVKELDGIIIKELKGIYCEQNITRKSGKKNKYPLGTAIRIEADNKIFILIATTEFDTNNRATISQELYIQILNKLLSYLHDKAQGNTVHLPLIGTGQSGIIKEIDFCSLFYYLLKTRSDVHIRGGVKIIISQNSNLNLWKVSQTLQ